MQKIILVTGLLMTLCALTFGQCPTAGFSVTDSICAGNPFQVSNTSSGGISYAWDFCPYDLESTPVSSLFSNDGALNFPQQLRLIKDAGNYHLFVVNFISNSLIRYDFGTSLDNTPSIFDYGNAAGLLNQPAGLDVVQEGSTWYAIVANYGANNIARLDLGTVITNNTVTGAAFSGFNLNAPRVAKVAKDGTDYYVFISNFGNTELTKINFGNSLSNTPSGSFSLSHPSFDVPWGFDIAYDCTLGSWVGFYASNTLSIINVIDFGASLANNGTVVSSVPAITNPAGIILIHEGSNWNILTNSFAPPYDFQKITLSGNLLSPALNSVSYPVTQNSSPRNISYYNDSTGIHVFIANNAPSTINKLLFTGSCSAVPRASNSSTTVDVTSGLNNDYQLVTLEVTGNDGLVSYYTDSVYMSEAPQAGFVFSSACEGQIVSFTDSSILNPVITSTWQWDFGDTTPVSNDQNPDHLFPATGTYNVTLTVTYPTGCFDVFSDSVFVAPLPVADFSFVNNQCSFVPVNFTDLSQAFSGTVITNWEWDFGDTTAIDTVANPVHTYVNSGTFTVVLTVTTDAGCTDSIAIDITILPSPVADFTVTSTCINEIAEFVNNTTIQGGIQVDYDWDFGDTGISSLVNPTHQYAASAANYDVTLIANAINGCVDTLVKNIRISNKPVAQFSWSPLVVCAGNTINFSSTSTGTNGDTISVYIWDFGDSGTSGDENPVYAYADTGFYDVTLTVVSPTYCDSSVTQQLYVIPSPTASFTAAGVCLGLNTSFNPLTTTPPNTQIDSIVWTFGDGNGFTGLSSPSHPYTLPGRYEVTMTVYNNLLCTAFFSDSVDVFPLPVADFTFSILCSDSLALFDGSSSSISGDSITSWLWDFGGLGTLTGEMTSFNFTTAGNYDVTLITTSSHGCQDTLMQSVTVIQSPEFDFVFNEPCFGLPSLFTYIPDITPAPNAILTWDFGDSTTSGILNPAHIYSTVDTFVVSLRVEHNATSCAATILKTLIVKPYPDAGFSFISNCENLPLQFTDTTSIIAGTLSGWNWNFGVLGNSSQQNPVVIAADPGLYPVVLTVTSAEGCASTVTDTVNVFANPDAEFVTDPLFGSPPLVVNYVNTTTGAVTYDWDFGDGSTGTGFSPNHTYQDTGFYQVTLIATSTEGCKDTVQQILSVLFPYMDLAVTKVFALEDDELLTLFAEISNFGNVPANSFELSGIIDDGSLINEAWTGNLQPGTSLIYKFNARYSISENVLPDYYCVEVMNPNNGIDRNRLNNNKCGVTGNSFQIYNGFPNPFINEVSIGFNQPEEDVYNLEIYDALGQLVYQNMNQPGKKGFNKITISTTAFRKGIYAVRMEFRDKVESITIMKY